VHAAPEDFIHADYGTNGEYAPRRQSYWKVEKETAATELAAVSDLDFKTGYAFVNPNLITAMGNERSYKLVPAANSINLMDENDFPGLRATFAYHHVWVTPYQDNEQWSAGEFPNQSQGDDGLGRWVEQDRPIVNTDLVLWYTLGFSHIPVQEDFPVMPVMGGSFELKPGNFFETNPLLTQKFNTAWKACKHNE